MTIGYRADEPRPEDPRVEVLLGLLADGRRVPVRIQHNLLTGVMSGTI